MIGPIRAFRRIEAPRLLTPILGTRSGRLRRRRLRLCFRRPVLERRRAAPAAIRQYSNEWSFRPTFRLDLGSILQSRLERILERPGRAPASRRIPQAGTLRHTRIVERLHRETPARRSATRPAGPFTIDLSPPAISVLLRFRISGGNPRKRQARSAFPLHRVVALRHGADGRPGKDGESAAGPRRRESLRPFTAREPRASVVVIPIRPRVYVSATAKPLGGAPASTRTARAALRFRTRPSPGREPNALGHVRPDSPASRPILPVEIVYRTREEARTLRPETRRAAAAATPAQPPVDVRRLSRDVIRQIDRHIRIERERRGRI